MKDQATEAKIKKYEEKKKSKPILKIMDAKHADSEVICAALDALKNIADEDAVNHITHYLDHEDAAVRLAACKAGIAIGTEYMNTRVRHQLSIEKDPETKKAIQEAFNNRTK